MIITLKYGHSLWGGPGFTIMNVTYNHAYYDAGTYKIQRESQFCLEMPQKP